MTPAPPWHAFSWKIWADTGGTFTDCLAVDPAGRLHRAKVLSTSAVRGRIAAQAGADAVRVEPGWDVPSGFFRGFAFRLLGEDAESLEVLDWEPEGRLLRLAAAIQTKDLTGATFELRSPEEAPVLAARLVTGTALDAPLPPIAMRLATTRGTNALLERKGAATALFITRGFADLTVIGTQARPDLFALEIVRPAPLYREVVEVPERLAADGSVLLPLDVEALRETVQRLLDEGIESAAVALMHSYRNPRHEEELGELLRAAGFRHVSLSSRLAPLIKLLPRAETAVVDAYLSPILERYLSGVASALGPGSLHVMTSAGGLVRASSFRAKDGLLSGPAGGVVGAALAGRSIGFGRVIAFDMGGTSTDVARWDGDFEYLFEHRVGDAHLVAPALAIESVAAGGGSICSFDGAQLKVGPESAGAWPGPACYGAGGPLTLTDVNLILGRIDPSRFEIPLNPEAAAAALARLRSAMGDRDPGPEAVLAGFLEIADERMAEAIRAISLRRGFDPGAHALVAFGGAGAQHACAVAGLLGITSVVVPADAGLLSALGLGAAVVERFAHRQVLEPLARVRKRLAEWLAELGEEAAAAVETEGIAPEGITVRRLLLNLRFAGQEASLAVEYEGDDALEPAFDAAYREIYGYAPEGRAIELESIRVVASSRSAGEASVPAQTPAAHPAIPVGARRCWTGAGWREVSVFDRSALGPGATFTGPSLVFENHSATFVGETWRGQVDGAGHLVLVSARAVE
ncbi:MAG TPA: hydantoinase/oxoprolinase family protein [Thermoanaerobaculia bacterium]|jgi:5-oxoprolinase (ATP-hydrolysing)|nr:hydantoinase/oxoprolinase family protein [Thermoanaerobaculia bacterium]